MNRNFLLSSFLLLLSSSLGLRTIAQGPMRGETDLVTAQRSVEMVLIVEEIEQAGFMLDVEEGFDEDWEEAVWIDSDADDLVVTHLNPEDADLLDLEDMTTLEEDIEMDEQVLEESEILADQGMESDELSDEEAELEDPYASNFEEEISTEVEDTRAWWEEENDLDESWDELIDEWELEALENSYEEEDMEVLEALYEKG